MTSSRISESSGARSARKNATSARTGNGRRSQTVHRSTNGSLRSRRSVCAATKSGGRNHPIIITAGMAPIITVDAPSDAAKAGNTVADEINDRPTM